MKRNGREFRTTVVLNTSASGVPRVPLKGVPNHTCNLLLNFKSVSYLLHLLVNVGRCRFICSKNVYDKSSR